MYLLRAFINNQEQKYVCFISDPKLEDSLECYVECASEDEALSLLMAFVCILSDQYWEGYDDGLDEATDEGEGGDIDVL